MSYRNILDSILQAIEDQVMEYQSEATWFLKDRIQKLSLQYMDNDKQIQATQQVIDESYCSIIRQGDSFKLQIILGGNPDWVDVIQNGLTERVTKGGQAITNPDGSKQMSSANTWDVGRALPGTEQPASLLSDEVHKQLNELFYSYIDTVVASAINSSQVIQSSKEYINEMMSNGGE